MFQIKKELLKTAFFAAFAAFSMLASSDISAKDGVIATFNPPLVADRHSDARSSWNQNRQGSVTNPNQRQPINRQAATNRSPDQGYYYWNEQYFAGRPNMYNRPYYYYYYDPKYYYDDTNGGVRYYPNYQR